MSRLSLRLCYSTSWLLVFAYFPFNLLIQVSEDLAERADSFGIVLDDVSLTHLTFGYEFTSAVEQKQVAQQEAERARFVVEKVGLLSSRCFVQSFDIILYFTFFLNHFLIMKNFVKRSLWFRKFSNVEFSRVLYLVVMHFLSNCFNRRNNKK